MNGRTVINVDSVLLLAAVPRLIEKDRTFREFKRWESGEWMSIIVKSGDVTSVSYWVSTALTAFKNVLICSGYTNRTSNSDL